MSDIRIDAPGAGEWVMQRAEGYFRDGWDHAFTSHRGDKILGGIVLSGYLGGSIAVHMAAEDRRWCSRDLLWLAFHYAFEQLQCIKVLAPLRSDNYKALEINLRSGWQIEAVLRDAFPGAHMLVLSMTKDACPWLDYSPRAWKEAA